jgi:predicted DNA-binding transcriptional regulator YafY
MPANKYALLRYRIIDRCLTNSARPYPTREDLRDACEEALFGSGGDAISLSTIDKDIWAMKNEGELGYYAPIKYSRQHGGYFYEEEGYSISEFSLAEEDLQAIRFAAATLEQFRHMPILNQYENAIDKIISRVNISPNPADESIDRYIQFERSTVFQGNEWLGPLLDSIRQRHSIEIQYLKFSDDTLRVYELHPYLLKEYKSRWYLIAWDANREVIRTFGLERIQSLEKGTRKFQVRGDFNADVFFKHSIGITEKSGKPEKIQFSVTPAIGKFLKSQPIHASQAIVRENDEGFVFSLEVMITPELIGFLLTYGGQLRVLQPVKLLQVMHSEIEKMAAFYGNPKKKSTS